MENQTDKLKLTSTMLAACVKPSEVMELPAVQERWVDTYESTTGRKDGLLKFEAEKVLFLQTIGEDANLSKCSKVSIYSSFILLAVSGLSLKDGQSYLIPYKDKCIWMPGWKGRLEQIKQIPNVKYVNEPICVFDGEVFEYEIMDGEIKVLSHRPSLNTKGKDILAVYATIEYDFGKKTFLMKREEVLSIRDRYSQSYKDYIKIVPNAEGKRIKSGKTKDGRTYSFEIEEPMWVGDEIQAFKKTLIKRIYNTVPKSGSLKYLDKRIEETAQEIEIVGNSENFDTEEALEAKLRNAEFIEEAEFEETAPNAENPIKKDPDPAPEEIKTPTDASTPKEEKAPENTTVIVNELNNLFPEGEDRF